MTVLKLIATWVEKLAGAIRDALAPEDKKVQGLLRLDPGAMRLLLPKSPVNMKDVFALFDYGNKVVKLLVKSIKYKNNAGLKKRLAKYLYEEIIDISEDITLFHGSPPIVVPMPMSKKERNKRGFNQCEELCREIEKLSPSSGEGGIEICYDLLKKIKETKRQTELSREERMENVKNSMAVPEIYRGKIKNRSILVLDDVYTTLASFSEARRALLASGARAIYGLFIAH